VLALLRTKTMGRMPRMRVHKREPQCPSMPSPKDEEDGVEPSLEARIVVDLEELG